MTEEHKIALRDFLPKIPKEDMTATTAAMDDVFAYIDGLFSTGQFEEANEWFSKINIEEIQSENIIVSIICCANWAHEKLIDYNKLANRILERSKQLEPERYKKILKGFRFEDFR